MKDYKGKQKSASSMLKGCSYAKGGKVGKSKEVKVTDSEKNQEKKAVKEVGAVKGKESKGRLDKLARGGKARHKKGKTQVNVVVAPSEKKVPVPIPVPASASTGAAAPGLPAGLPSAPGAMPPMGAKKGGKVKKRAMGGKVPAMDAGAGGGKGRLEKSKMAAKTKKN